MKKLYLILILSFSFFNTKAQESTNASGGDASGLGGTAAYSFGQIFYSSNIGNTGTIYQGVQHAYEIFIVGLKETELNVSIVAFPNPTTENLTLKIENYNNEKFSYMLFDIIGKKLIEGQIVAHHTQINMNNLPTATYFINVINQEYKIVKSFKIIKK